MVIARRVFLRGLAALMLGAGASGCAQQSAPQVHKATPTASVQGQKNTVVFTYSGHALQVLTVAWSPDGRRVASGSWDETAQVWDAFSGDHALVYRRHTDAVTTVAWSPGGQRIASSSLDKTVQIWDASSGQHFSTYQRHRDGVKTVAWSPDGKLLASGSLDKTVQIWEAASGRLLVTYRGHTAGVTRLAWSPDGRRIASGSLDKTVRVWDAVSGKDTLIFRGHKDEITAVTWSPDGRFVASGSWDKTVQVWDALSGHVSYLYHGYNVEVAHHNPSKGVLPDLIFVVAWSHNGKRLAAVTQEYCGDVCGVILSWNAPAGGNFSFYPVLPTFALAWSPNDQYFATAVNASQVQIARVPPDPR